MNAPANDYLLTEVAGYYTDKLQRFGQTPKGVDWNGEEGQFLRFEQLARLMRGHTGFSVNDLGCGYGALVDFLDREFSSYHYLGVDVSTEMVEAAKQRWSNRPEVRFVASSQPDAPADFGVASGIFNVKMGREEAEWCAYVHETLDLLDRTSTKGFAFNCLTMYSDEDKKKPHLHYADPCALFDRCKRRYSRQVALLHDYGLYEFTILVRKS
jgi:SAM-dependent methyltransferase